MTSAHSHRLAPTRITEFRGKYSWLSNYYAAPVCFDGIVYPTNEHAFAAAKSTDVRHRQHISACATPGEAKRVGRHVRLREDWDTYRYTAMWQITCAKYDENPALAHKLVATGAALLVEGNTWCDQHWGTCRCGRHRSVWGSNILGIMLMHCRDLHQQPHRVNR